MRAFSKEPKRRRWSKARSVPHARLPCRPLGGEAATLFPRATASAAGKTTVGPGGSPGRPSARDALRSIRAGRTPALQLCRHSPVRAGGKKEGAGSSDGGWIVSDSFFRGGGSTAVRSRRGQRGGSGGSTPRADAERSHCRPPKAASGAGEEERGSEKERGRRKTRRRDGRDGTRTRESNGREEGKAQNAGTRGPGGRARWSAGGNAARPPGPRAQRQRSPRAAGPRGLPRAFDGDFLGIEGSSELAGSAERTTRGLRAVGQRVSDAYAG